jgi:hypothetical protein
MHAFPSQPDIGHNILTVTYIPNTQHTQQTAPVPDSCPSQLTSRGTPLHGRSSPFKQLSPEQENTPHFHTAS